MDKFLIVLEEIKKREISINKINFGGGEPTLDFNIVKNILPHLNPSTYVTVNTNGFNLDIFKSVIDKISCISLSRHHYDDATNNKIFGTAVASLKEIGEFDEKKKLHLRCNLIKGFIDSQDEAIKYIDALSSVGVFDFGFVSLMKINKFCEDNFIDYNTFDFDKTNRTRTCYTQERKGICNCKNFLYYTNGGDLVKMYSRVNHDVLFEASNLVYDIDKLKQGFNGEVVY